MAKYKQYFEDMLKQNQQLFFDFKQIHDQYILDPKAYQQQFNQIGYQVQDVVRRYENMLCGHSEGSGFGKYSANLAEKFHQEIKKTFPKIDYIGVQPS